MVDGDFMYALKEKCYYIWSSLCNTKSDGICVIQPKAIKGKGRFIQAEYLSEQNLKNRYPGGLVGGDGVKKKRVAKARK